MGFGHLALAVLNEHELLGLNPGQDCIRDRSAGRRKVEYCGTIPHQSALVE
jgi:hypothetical protein